MIGIWSEHSQQYLFYFGLLTLVLFCIPLFFKPLVWAKLLMWRIPEETNLAVYFGRCVGGLGLVIDFMVIRASMTGEGVQLAFEGLYVLLILMIVVHVYGAIKRIQPITETLEIGFWAGLLVLNLCFQPMVG
jgi:hypothetical protein